MINALTGPLWRRSGVFDPLSTTDYLLPRGRRPQAFFVRRPLTTSCGSARLPLTNLIARPAAACAPRFEVATQTLGSVQAARGRVTLDQVLGGMEEPRLSAAGGRVSWRQRRPGARQFGNGLPRPSAAATITFRYGPASTLRWRLSGVIGEQAGRRGTVSRLQAQGRIALPMIWAARPKRSSSGPPAPNLVEECDTADAGNSVAQVAPPKAGSETRPPRARRDRS